MEISHETIKNTLERQKLKKQLICMRIVTYIFFLVESRIKEEFIKTFFPFKILPHVFYYGRNTKFQREN
jgi:hypothetical protein